MESVIRKIFLGKNDEEVHSDFVKYSKGTFPDKYLLSGKKQKNGWSIKTGPEFVNYLVRKCLEKVSEEIDVTGVIVATFYVKEKAEFPIERVKQFMGVKQSIVNVKTTPDKIISLMNLYPKAFFALSFSSNNFQLKIKPKAPKSPKPSNKADKEIVADFCSLKTSDIDVVEDLFFDAPEFKEINVNHTFIIDKIELPSGVKDPVQLREKAIRKGKIFRISTIDGKEIKQEKNFEA